MELCDAKFRVRFGNFYPAPGTTFRRDARTPNTARSRTPQSLNARTDSRDTWPNSSSMMISNDTVNMMVPSCFGCRASRKNCTSPGLCPRRHGSEWLFCHGPMHRPARVVALRHVLLQDIFHEGKISTWTISCYLHFSQEVPCFRMLEVL